MTVRIVGLVGSIRKGRNTEYLVAEALKAAEEVGDVETELVTLWDKTIKPCIGCNKCIYAGKKETRPCPQIDDDYNVVIPKLIEADGIVFGSCIYCADVPAQVKAFMDRCEAVAEYNTRRQFKQALRNKVGGAIAVGNTRHGGHEPTIDAIHRFFLAMGMIVVGSCELATSYVGCWMGGAGVVYPHGHTSTPGAPVRDDERGVRSSRFVGRRVALVTKLVKPQAAHEREEWLEWSDRMLPEPLKAVGERAKKRKV